jgi:membrane protein DedA with SNARE-associated domain
LLNHIVAIVVNFIIHLGYWGVGVGMAIESANIPLPSEVILPFGGYLASQAKLTYWGVVLAGTIGGIAGSALSYALGYWGGRPLLVRYGRYISVTENKLDQADRWFARYGNFTVMFARVLPIVRTFISLPAGIARINFPLFILYTLIGSLPWCMFLTFLGVKMGQNWDVLSTYFHRVDLLIGAVIVALILYSLYRSRKRRR